MAGPNRLKMEAFEGEGREDVVAGRRWHIPRPRRHNLIEEQNLASCSDEKGTVQIAEYIQGDSGGRIPRFVDLDLGSFPIFSLGFAVAAI